MVRVLSAGAHHQPDGGPPDALVLARPWAPAFALAGNAERHQRMRRVLAWLPLAGGSRVARGLRDRVLTSCMPYTDLQFHHGRLQLTSCRFGCPWGTVIDRY
jgi:hypothetical protein